MYIFCEVGIHLTQVATICSMACRWKISRGICWNSRLAFRRRRPAGSICFGSAGLTAFAARAVAGGRLGRYPAFCCNVPRCDYQSSVTAGTIFQDTRKPLTLWFRAVWWVTSQKNGASAMGLQRVLGLKSYKTAWTLAA